MTDIPPGDNRPEPHDDLPPSSDPSTQRTPQDGPSAYRSAGNVRPPIPAGSQPPPGYPPPPGYLPPPWTPGARAAAHAGPYDPLVSADYSGWWQRSIALLRAAWRPMAVVQLIGSAPLVVFGIVTAVLLLTTDLADRLDEPAVAVPVILPIGLIAVLLTLITQLATLETAVQRATGRPVSAAAAFRAGLRRSPAYIGWGIPAGLLFLVGVICCILPAFYVGAVMTILPVIVLVERGGVLKRAFALFHGDLGSSVARVATLAALQTVVGVAANLGSILVFIDPTGVSAGLLSVVFSIATGVLVTPFLLTTYADMRARVEPFSTADLAR
ncbi:hypothetical protein AB0J83_11375 [Actinoplanes sp. NPDC049596]|uniref:hypothetical protein n=1 Tax=unclassified Actinoplanes TaxID=2626549 RepID=UPI00341E8E10